MTFGNVLILGDSYSTFEGHIPSGYESWYYTHPLNDTDVDRAEQTWWWQLLEDTDSRLVLNCSWSGTTICHTGYGGDCSDRSFVSRFDRLCEEGYFDRHPVDTVMIFGGTNDFWAGSPLGELQYADWQREDLYAVLPAVGYLLHRVTATLPRARVLFIVNTDLSSAITDGIKAACAAFGVSVVAPPFIAKQAGHPNVEGMTQIARAVQESML